MRRPRRKVPGASSDADELSSPGWRLSRAVLGGLVAQGVSSGTNFAVLVFAARSQTADDFGAFSLVLSLLLLALAASRALSVEPLLVLKTSPSAEARRADRAALGTCLALGVTCGLLFAVAGLLAAGSLRTALEVAALFAPIVFVQDGVRYAFFAARRSLVAGALDGIWAVAILGAVIAGIEPTVGAAMALWGGGAALSGAVGLVVLRAGPSPRSALRWLRSTSHLGLPYLGEFVVAIGATQAVLVVLAAVADLAAAGAVRAAQTVFGPLTVVFAGSYLVVVPHVRSLFDGARRSLTRVVVGLSLAFTLASGLWTLVAVALPDRVGRGLFGDSWDAASALLLPLGVSYVLSASAIGAIVSMRGGGATTAALRTRVVTVPAVVALPIIGAALDAARGFVLGTAVANAVVSVAWWQAARRTVLVPTYEVPAGLSAIAVDFDLDHTVVS